MPYSRLSDLPDKIQKLPKHAQEIYRKAFNSAWRQYADPSERRRTSTREVTAHRVAWNAVKHSYRKREDSWIRK